MHHLPRDACQQAPATRQTCVSTTGDPPPGPRPWGISTGSVATGLPRRPNIAICQMGYWGEQPQLCRAPSVASLVLLAKTPVSFRGRGPSAGKAEARRQEGVSSLAVQAPGLPGTDLWPGWLAGWLAARCYSGLSRRHDKAYTGVGNMGKEGTSKNENGFRPLRRFPDPPSRRPAVKPPSILFRAACGA